MVNELVAVATAEPEAKERELETTADCVLIEKLSKCPRSFHELERILD